jgi:serine/threonine-protein kinase 11
MVHQDIKPSNLLAFDGGVVKIADFGIGHSFSSADAVIGTPAYQAPEFLSEVPSDPAKGDVWSLGVSIYECVVGRVPFDGESVYEIARQSLEPIEFPGWVSEEFRDLVVGMLAADPEARMSMEDVAEHRFFRKEEEPIGEWGETLATMKQSKSLVFVAADVCDDDYWFTLPEQPSSWPGRSGLRHLSSFVC